jgi:Holliday junction DNA helicase RuvA
MIGSLEGCLRERRPDAVLIDVGGVGYEVFVPLSTFLELPAEGKTIRLRVHTHVREDALLLYGFWTELERTVFRLLIGISKIGPRIALGILSGIPAARLIQAVRQQDLSAFRGIPGVGGKTAERIAIELRDKVAGLAALPAADGPAHDDLEGATLSALLNLGYPRGQAERAVQSALERLGAPASLEALIREALRLAAG